MSVFTSAIDIDSAVLDAYVGEYELRAGQVLTITKEDGNLFAQLTGQMKIDIHPESETDFFYKIVNAQISFVKNKDGDVTHLVIHQNGVDLQADKL